jgi:hypothetical protein
VRELRLAEQAHRELPGRVEEAYRAAHRLACQEWSVRQFIGRAGRAVARIVDTIAGGCELLEVRCRRCSHESLIDLTEVVWPREKPVHTLAKVLRCQACKDERKRPQPDLVALRPRHPEGDPPVAKRRGGRT